MIKGKIVAQVEIDISVDENTPGLLPFDEFKNEVKEKASVVLQDMLEDEFGDIGTVKVTQLYADAWMEALKDGKGI